MGNESSERLPRTEGHRAHEQQSWDPSPAQSPYPLALWSSRWTWDAGGCVGRKELVSWELGLEDGGTEISCPRSAPQM